MSEASIEPARPADLDEVLALLQRSGLPLDGAADCVRAMLVLRAADGVSGCAALELYGEDALLRSVVVDASRRGTGEGLALTRAALQMAAERGARSVYLLTTTAAAFFPRFGFAPVSREEVPAAVRQSVEFTSACPASAVVMVARVS
jgi:amino-acid N-acetyltransferase